MVATSYPLATKIGLQILKDGGNAIDAAIAANAALGLMEPTGGGIGGDLFAIVWSGKEKKLYGPNTCSTPSSLCIFGIFNLLWFPSKRTEFINKNNGRAHEPMLFTLFDVWLRGIV
jgi:hypothetical protein